MRTIDNRYLFRAHIDGDFIRLSARSKFDEHRANTYYIQRNRLWEWLCSHEDTLIWRDCHGYAELNKVEHGISVMITNLSVYIDGDLTGNQDKFTIPDSDFRGFVGYGEDGEDFKCLDTDLRPHPKIVVMDNRNLHNVVTHPIYRRKFARFMGSHFDWPCDSIELWNDFDRHSFYFVERYADGSKGICGGVILHGQDDPKNASYGMHT